MISGSPSATHRVLDLHTSGKRQPSGVIGDMDEVRAVIDEAWPTATEMLRHHATLAYTSELESCGSRSLADAPPRLLNGLTTYMNRRGRPPKLVTEADLLEHVNKYRKMNGGASAPPGVSDAEHVREGEHEVAAPSSASSTESDQLRKRRRLAHLACVT